MGPSGYKAGTQGSKAVFVSTLEDKWDHLVIKQAIRVPHHTKFHSDWRVRHT